MRALFSGVYFDLAGKGKEKVRESESQKVRKKLKVETKKVRKNLSRTFRLSDFPSIL